MAHIRQSQPDYGPGFHVKVVEFFQGSEAVRVSGQSGSVVGGRGLAMGFSDAHEDSALHEGTCVCPILPEKNPLCYY